LRRSPEPTCFDEQQIVSRTQDREGWHRVGGPPKPYQPPEAPDGKVNVTDPDTRRLKAREGYIQGFNAQAVIDAGQIVLAAEITNGNVDWAHLDPMITAALAEFEQAGIRAQIETALADAQYWNEEHMDEVIANKHIQVLIPAGGSASGKRAGKAAATRGCAQYSLPNTATSSTSSENTWSSRYSDTPVTTEVSPGSYAEDAAPSGPRGDY
jgi:hypothetical protein